MTTLDLDPNTAQADGEGPVLEVSNLRTWYPVRSRYLRRVNGYVHAVDGVSLSIAPRQTLALVGESGCGKSTLARTVMGLVEPREGTIRLNGAEVLGSSKRAVREHRRNMQLIFQDPIGSLDPRQRVSDIIAEPLAAYKVMDKASQKQRVHELLELVGLSARHAQRFPHEFSGGQRQRIGIARALALRPKLLVLDEPVSALDVSIQAQVLNLLQELQDELGLSYLLISHDLAVVRHVAHKVAVMYLGKIVEHGDTAELLAAPAHPYTQALISAVPNPDPALRNRQRIRLDGDLPSPIDPLPGCRFRTRCRLATPLCSSDEPALLVHDGVAHPCACHFAETAVGFLGEAGLDPGHARSRERDDELEASNE